jgi:hypothetical protein
MRLRFHRLREIDADFELIFGVLVLPILMLAAWFVVRHPDRFPMFCLFHRWTGLPCPACGSFRALQQLGTGHPIQAWRLNPLATVLSIVAGVFVVYAWIAVLFRLPRPRLEGVSRRARGMLIAAVALAVLANWAWLLASRI